MYIVHCRACGKDGTASEVKRHTDRKLILRCTHCCSTNVKITSINANGGQTFGATHVEAGGIKGLFRRALHNHTGAE